MACRPGGAIIGLSPSLQVFLRFDAFHANLLLYIITSYASQSVYRRLVYKRISYLYINVST